MKRIDCFRKRHLGMLRFEAECPPEPEECGYCPSPLSCQEQLVQHERALFELINGGGKQEVQEGDRRVRYFHSVEHIKCLKEKISILKMQCGGDKSTYGTTCNSGCLEQYGVFERTRPPPIRICTRRWSGR